MVIAIAGVILSGVLVDHTTKSMYLACENGDSDRITSLIVRFPKIIEACNASNVPILCVAAGSGNSSCVRYLLSIGADCSVRDHLGRSPLDIAVALSDSQVVESIASFTDLSDLPALLHCGDLNLLLLTVRNERSSDAAERGIRYLDQRRNLGELFSENVAAQTVVDVIKDRRFANCSWFPEAVQRLVSDVRIQEDSFSAATVYLIQSSLSTEIVSRLSESARQAGKSGLADALVRESPARDAAAIDDLASTLASGQVKKADFLLRSMPIPRTQMEKAFHLSVYRGDLFYTCRLWSKAINLDLTDREGRSPLHIAAGSMNSPILYFLLGNGADPRVVDVDGRNVLHLLSIGESNMRSKGVSLDSLTFAMLWYAAVERGASDQVIDGRGRTPREYASKTLLQALEDAESIKENAYRMSSGT